MLYFALSLCLLLCGKQQWVPILLKRALVVDYSCSMYDDEGLRTPALKISARTH